jgi:uncharacterized protein YbcI
MEAAHQDRAPSDRAPSAEAVISTASVQIVRRYTGRGPTRARTTITNELVTILMRDTLTPGERNLVEAGVKETVLELRSKYQQIMSDELIALVEAQTQRKVEAFMSNNHTDPDVAVEIFVLAPRGE